jgi:hypothetical protein
LIAATVGGAPASFTMPVMLPPLATASVWYGAAKTEGEATRRIAVASLTAQADGVLTGDFIVAAP